jgi:hypothetical protein
MELYKCIKKRFRKKNRDLKGAELLKHGRRELTDPINIMLVVRDLPRSFARYSNNNTKRTTKKLRENTFVCMRRKSSENRTKALLMQSDTVYRTLFPFIPVFILFFFIRSLFCTINCVMRYKYRVFITSFSFFCGTLPCDTPNFIKLLVNVA